jgi:hypothetical protein
MARSLDDAMRLLQQLDRDVHLRLSMETGRWYVSMRVDLADGVLLYSAACQHRRSPQSAVMATLDVLQFPPDGQAVYVRGQHRYVRWSRRGWVTTERPAYRAVAHV